MTRRSRSSRALPRPGSGGAQGCPDSGRTPGALAVCAQALAIDARFAKAWLGRGSLLCELKRHGDALAAYDKALELRNDFAEAWAGRGNVFYELKRPEEALAAYDKALQLDADV